MRQKQKMRLIAGHEGKKEKKVRLKGGVPGGDDDMHGIT
jgi:hypothetical protein